MARHFQARAREKKQKHGARLHPPRPRRRRTQRVTHRRESGTRRDGSPPAAKFPHSSPPSPRFLLLTRVLLLTRGLFGCPVENGSRIHDEVRENDKLQRSCRYGGSGLLGLFRRFSCCRCLEGARFFLLILTDKESSLPRILPIFCCWNLTDFRLIPL